MDNAQKKAIEMYGGSCYTCIRPKLMNCWSDEDGVTGCKYHEWDSQSLFNQEEDNYKNKVSDITPNAEGEVLVMDENSKDSNAVIAAMNKVGSVLAELGDAITDGVFPIMQDLHKYLQKLKRRQRYLRRYHRRGERMRRKS